MTARPAAGGVGSARWPWLALLAIGVVTAVVFWQEQVHFDALRSWLRANEEAAKGPVDVFWWMVGDFGHGETFPLLFAAVLALGGSARRLQDGVLAAAIAGVVANVVKLVVMRDRPGFGPSFAWPSGHTSGAVAFAAALSGWTPAVTVGSWLAALGVGTSRVLRGRHWPADVCGGFLVGTGSALLARRLPLWLPTWLERREVRIAVAWFAVAGWAMTLLWHPSAREVQVLINSLPALACGLWAAGQFGRGREHTPLDPSADARGRSAMAIGVLFAMVATLGVAGANALVLLDVDEPRFAAASRTMLQTGDWIVPHFNGAVRYDKPILIYWAQAAAMWLFGIGEGAARLPSAVGVAVAAVATAGIARHLGLGRWPALLAGLAAGTVPLAQGLAHGATADALLYGLCTAIAWLQVRRWRCGGSAATWWGLWVGIGLAFLVKGPAALVGPLALGLGLWWAGDRPRWLTQLGGVLVCAAVIAAWAVPALIATDGGFWTVGVGRHVVERSSRPFEGHGGYAPWWFLTYFVTIPLTMLPWSLLLPWGLRMLRARGPGGSGAGDSGARGLARVLLAWVGGVVLVFTLVVSKLPHYVLPCYPALAIAIFAGLPVDGRPLRGTGIAARVLGVVVAVALPTALGIVGLVHAVVPATVAGLGLGTALWLSGRHFASGALPAAVATLGIGTWISMAVLFARGVPLASEDMLTSAIRGELAAQVRPGETVHLFHFVAPSVTYYLGAVTPELRDDEQALRLLATPGQLLLLRDRERDNLRRLAATAATAAVDRDAVHRALEMPLWCGRGFHPTKGKCIDVYLLGTRAAPTDSVRPRDG